MSSSLGSHKNRKNLGFIWLNISHTSPTWHSISSLRRERSMSLLRIWMSKRNFIFTSLSFTQCLIINIHNPSRTKHRIWLDTMNTLNKSLRQHFSSVVFGINTKVSLIVAPIHWNYSQKKARNSSAGKLNGRRS